MPTAGAPPPGPQPAGGGARVAAMLTAGVRALPAHELRGVPHRGEVGQAEVLGPQSPPAAIAGEEHGDLVAELMFTRGHRRPGVLR